MFQMLQLLLVCGSPASEKLSGDMRLEKYSTTYCRPLVSVSQHALSFMEFHLLSRYQFSCEWRTQNFETHIFLLLSAVESPVNTSEPVPLVMFES